MVAFPFLARGSQHAGLGGARVKPEMAPQIQARRAMLQDDSPDAGATLPKVRFRLIQSAIQPTPRAPASCFGAAWMIGILGATLSLGPTVAGQLTS